MCDDEESVGGVIKIITHVENICECCAVRVHACRRHIVGTVIIRVCTLASRSTRPAKPQSNNIREELFILFLFLISSFIFLQILISNAQFSHRPPLAKGGNAVLGSWLLVAAA